MHGLAKASPHSPGYRLLRLVNVSEKVSTDGLPITQRYATLNEKVMRARSKIVNLFLSTMKLQCWRGRLNTFWASRLALGPHGSA